MLTTSNYLTSVGLAVRELRKEKDLKQMELAVAVGVERSHISRVEQGTKKASLELLVKISGVLGVSLSELIERAEAISG